VLFRSKDVCRPSSDGLQRINSETGEVIRGRQQFPLIYQLNSSLTIMAYSHLDQVSGHFYDEHLRALVLDGRDLLCIRNEHDYMNMKTENETVTHDDSEYC
jgi:hypothetical protein